MKTSLFKYLILPIIIVGSLIIGVDEAIACGSVTLTAKPQYFNAGKKTTSRITARVIAPDGTPANGTITFYILNSPSSLDRFSKNTVTIHEGAANVVFTHYKSEPGIIDILAVASITIKAQDGTSITFYPTGYIELFAMNVILGDEPHYMSAETKWYGMSQEEQQTVVSVSTNPSNCENAVVLKIRKVILNIPTTGKGDLVKTDALRWTYTAFIENKGEKHPALYKNVEIISLIEKDESAGLLPFPFIQSVFQYLANSRIGKEDRERAWQYVKWKYNIKISSLSGVSYSSSQETDGLTNTYTDICTLGPGAFSNENHCASTLGHENVHGRQSAFYIMRSVVSWAIGRPHFAEVEAYNWEIDNAEKTGIDLRDISEAIAWRDYYNRKGTKPQ